MIRLPNEILGLIVEYSKGEDVITLSQTGYFGVFEKILRRHVRSTIVFDSLNVTDAGLEHLKGVHTINLTWCEKVTDAGLKYLNGVHEINLSDCEQVTNAGLKHLKGVHTIDLSCCYKVTDAGLEHLKGVHTICLYGCPQVKNDYIMVLRQSGVIVRN